MNAIVSAHGYLIGLPVVGVWAVIMFWSLALWPLRFDDTPTFWRAVSVAQVLLVLQLVVGLVLLAWWLLGGGQPPGANSGGGWFNGTFHLLYGVVFPFVVLLVGHRVARGGNHSPHAVFAVVGLVNFGLTARAFMVGAGMGA
jgi:hypothetical protein